MKNQVKSPFFKELYDITVGPFKNHLLLNNNKRIIFSGKFGVGKTFFIKKFFEDHKSIFNNEEKEFEVYHLFPVNYSISSNEDIFQYLKYDILIEMLKKGITIDDNDLDFWYSLPLSVRKSIPELTTKLIEIIPSLGIDGVGDGSSAAIIGLIDLYGKAKEFYKKEIEGKSDSDILAAFMDDINHKKGSIYSHDTIVQIIEGKISKEDGKEKVLILDDLDRIDPEHVFRILNVFAAHYDNEQHYISTNKFGFDKVVLVCDINNIRRIFSNKYGMDVDFNGYIDKFYSVEIFQYDNINAIRSVVESCLNEIDFGIGGEVRYRLALTQHIVKPLSILLTVFYRQGHISLRSLLKLHNYRLKVNSILLEFPNSLDVYLFSVTPIVWFEVLQLLLSGEESFVERLNSLNEDFHLDETAINYFCSYLMLLLSSDKHRYRGTRNPIGYQYGTNSLAIDATEDSSPILNVQVTHAAGGRFNFYFKDFKDFMIKAFKFQKIHVNRK